MFCDALVLSHAVLVNQANGSSCVYKRVCVCVCVCVEHTCTQKSQIENKPRVQCGPQLCAAELSNLTNIKYTTIKI